MEVITRKQCHTVAGKPGNGSLWLLKPDFEAVTGFGVNPDGFCRDGQCLAVPASRRPDFLDEERINLSAFARLNTQPLVCDESGEYWLLDDSIEARNQRLLACEAPDFELPDLDGKRHRLSDYFGKKILLANWASWCGCRTDLTAWQALHWELSESGFVVIAVALDSRGVEGTTQWIRKCEPDYPCLIDERHDVAALYNMTNVPQAVWIDENGAIVRPLETAGATEGFRRIDPKTFKMPPVEVERARSTRKIYLDAIRDWVANGGDSEFALSPAEVRSRTPQFTEDTATAYALFRLGQELVSRGLQQEGIRLLDHAANLNPDAWSIWRQKADLEEVGKSMGPEFWQRVKGLGDRYYYPPIDMAGLN